ncbi:phosphoribosylglycinamide formyltransferase [gamma proteobacterium HdN1]|nr:phosphoribosylglycinamide formyltransferase [gamma proteobacterium HdN1]
MTHSLRKPLGRYAVLISGSGTNLQSLIDANERGEITGEICVVVSSRADAFGLERAKRHHIPTAVINHREYSTREEHDAALQAILETYQPDLVVLAGFMRVLTPAFTAYYGDRLFNIHPSLLPAYRGLHTHQRVLEAGERKHGCTVHFTTAELDGGPIIAQARVPVLPTDTESTLAARVQKMEHPLYTYCVHLFMAGRLRLDTKSGTVLLDNRPLIHGELDMEWPST